MTTAIAISVRDATSSDLRALSDAHRLGHAAVAEERGGRLDTLLRGRGEPIEESFDADIKTADIRVRVGLADEIFVGYCVLSHETLRSAELLARVNDLWVHPSARGIGVGYALMQDAVDHSRSLGCIGIDARALPGDRSTKNFFESFGLVARGLEVHQAF